MLAPAMRLLYCHLAVSVYVYFKAWECEVHLASCGAIHNSAIQESLAVYIQ